MPSQGFSKQMVSIEASASWLMLLVSSHFDLEVLARGSVKPHMFHTHLVSCSWAFENTRGIIVLLDPFTMCASAKIPIPMPMMVYEPFPIVMCLLLHSPLSDAICVRSAVGMALWLPHLSFYVVFCSTESLCLPFVFQYSTNSAHPCALCALTVHQQHMAHTCMHRRQRSCWHSLQVLQYRYAHKCRLNAHAHTLEQSIRLEALPMLSISHAPHRGSWADHGRHCFLRCLGSTLLAQLGSRTVIGCQPQCTSFPLAVACLHMHMFSIVNPAALYATLVCLRLCLMLSCTCMKY